MGQFTIKMLKLTLHKIENAEHKFDINDNVYVVHISKIDIKHAGVAFS